MSLSEHDKRFLELARKWLSGTISKEEKVEFEQWYNSFDDTYEEKLSDETVEQLEVRLHQNIFEKAGIPQPIRISKIRLWPRISAAASVLLILSVGGYFLLHKKQPTQQIAQNQIHDIAPGHNQATLTLAGGQKIILTKGLNGKLAQQGNMVIRANSGNAITYTPETQIESAVAYNTLSTSKGEVSPYPLVLADGTKVWLNAASSVTFPTAFTGNDREVKITGEVYFEVTHNAAKPFRVQSNEQTVEVLGTHFDVNSYADEPATRTTLVEGRVKVTVKNNEVAFLAPGQQSILPANEKIKVVSTDIDLTMAWKEGMFRFDGTTLESIMRQVSRWYDVEVVYQDEALKAKTFFAMSTRFANVSQLLRDLQQTGEAKFKIEGKRITVLDK